ncbi:unnamed protein product [Closterium sp. NIES-54]
MDGSTSAAGSYAALGGSRRSLSSLPLSTIHEGASRQWEATVASSKSSSSSAMSSPRRQHQRESLRQLRERMAQIDRRLAAMRSAEGDAAATRGEMSVPPPFAPLQHETRPGAGPSQNHEPIVLCRNYPVAGDTLTVMKHRKSWSESVSAAGSSNAAADSQETPGTPLLFPKAVSDLGPDPLPRAASLGSVRRRIPYGPVCPETLNAVGVTRLLATKLRVPATVVPETQTDRHVDFPAPKSNADGRAIANDPATKASEQTLIAIANGGCDNVEAKLSGQYQPSPLPASEAPLYIEINGNGLKRGNSSCLCVMSNELKGRPERYLRRDAGAMGKAGGVRLFGREEYSGVDGVKFSSSTGTRATGATGTLTTGATGTRATGVTGSAANSEREEQRTHGQLEQRAHGQLEQRAHGRLAQRSHRRLEPPLARVASCRTRLFCGTTAWVIPPLPAPPCLPCVEGRQRAAPHSSLFPLTIAPLQTLPMDVWGPARVSGQGRERYFLLVVDDYTRYTTVFPLRSKGEVVDALIPWIRTVRLQLRERFGQDLPVLRLHSDRGVMEVARTSMIHAAAPHFLWPFAVRCAAHQLNLWPRVSLPETSPTLRWTGEVGDASVLRGPAPSGVSQVDPLPGPTPVQVAVGSGAARGAASGGVAYGGAEPGGAVSEGAETGGAEPGGVETRGAEPGGVEPEGVEPGGTASEGAESGGFKPQGVVLSGGCAGASPRLSLQQLREWFVRGTCLWSGATGAGAAGAAGAGVAAGSGVPGGTAAWGTALLVQYRSSQGYTFSLGSGTVLWQSTRSSSVLSSSCEAEIYAGAMAAQELRWLTYLLTDLGEQPRSPPVLYVDNKAMIALCQEHRMEHRTKQIALRYFLARELQQRGQLRLAYVATRANTADIFTKALPPDCSDCSGGSDGISPSPSPSPSASAPALLQSPSLPSLACKTTPPPASRAADARARMDTSQKRHAELTPCCYCTHTASSHCAVHAMFRTTTATTHVSWTTTAAANVAPAPALVDIKAAVFF